MRIISLNANGIRAARRKGLFEWLESQNADIVCLQETRAQVDQLADEAYHPHGYHVHYRDAEKKGYSGVAIYSRHRPRRVITELGMPEFDAEGRYIEMQFDRLAVVSVYLPSGTSGDARQAAKYRFLDHFHDHLRRLRRRRREYVLCGDWNIAHKPIDLKNWKSNQKNSGFLPEERAWLDRVFDRTGYVDAFRALRPEPELYTWWSNRGRAWDKNVGWRIDYQVVTPGLAPHLRAASIYTDQRFSDHAPLIIDYDYSP